MTKNRENKRIRRKGGIWRTRRHQKERHLLFKDVTEINKSNQAKQPARLEHSGQEVPNTRFISHD